MRAHKTGGLPYPMGVIVLDFIGATLIGVGLFEWHAGAEFVPLAWRFENYHLVMIGAGFLLMLPLFFYFIRNIRRTREAGMNRTRS